MIQGDSEEARVHFADNLRKGALLLRVNPPRLRSLTGIELKE
jgi:hypothetical protein